MGGNCIVVIRGPGLLVKVVYMQSKRALCTTNHKNMHTCKTSKKFFHNFLYKQMKYSNKARRDNCITNLTAHQLCQGRSQFIRYLLTLEQHPRFFYITERILLNDQGYSLNRLFLPLVGPVSDFKEYKRKRDFIQEFLKYLSSLSLFTIKQTFVKVNQELATCRLKKAESLLLI